MSRKKPQTQFDKDLKKALKNPEIRKVYEEEREALRQEQVKRGETVPFDPSSSDHQDR